MTIERWGQYGGPSAGYVRTRIFPRTDYGLWPPTVPPSFDPTVATAALAQLAGSFRFGQVWILDATASVPAMTVTVTFDPSASGPPWLHGFRAAGRDRQPRLSDHPTPWVPVPIFDPLLWPSVGIGDERLRARKWWTSDPFQDAWLYTNLPPPFDPALFPPSIQLGGSFRTGGTSVLDLSGTLGVPIIATPFDPALYVAAIQHYGAAHWRKIDLDWDIEDTVTFGVPIPYLPQILQLLESSRRTRSLKYWTAEPGPPAWIFVNLPAAPDTVIALRLIYHYKHHH